MKKNCTIILLLIISLSGFGQYHDAPWQKKASQGQEQSFETIINFAESYWKDKQISKKGSGYKPYKRWEHFWKDQLDDAGYIAKPSHLWDAWAQKKIQKKNQRSQLALPASNWQPVGPFTHTNTGSWSSGQGRVNVVCVDPNNASTIYIGAPAGGIWRSTNSGSTWTPLSDNLPQIGVSGIAVDHTNSNTIYIATGDCDGGDSYSVGVLKSIDGGATWNATGLAFANTSSSAGDLIMHPTNSQILFCATNVGLYKTTNGGTNWAVVSNDDFSSGNVRFKPTDSNTIYAVSNNTFYKSTDGGTTFNAIASNLPAGATRLRLDVTPADGNYVYILASDPAFMGIYRSVDSGTTWNKTSTAATPDVFNNSPQAGYDLALAVSPTNKNLIFTGCLNVWSSSDGGVAFNQLNSWSNPSGAAYTHADIHFLKFFGNSLYAGTDGGIYKSTNNGAAFSDLTAGLQISQFYKIAVSKQSVSKMVGGLQDNGGHAYSNNVWKNYYGADGMDTGVDPTNSNRFYGFIQNGSSMYISADAGNSNASGVGAPAAETNSATGDDGGNWVTPLTVNSVGEVFAGYSRLYRLIGSAWAQQSVGTIGTGDIELVEIDPSNDNTMYVANGTRLYKSTDRGINFNNTYTAASNITSICVNKNDSNVVYLTTSGTNGRALKSVDGGVNFVNYSTNLPAISKNVIRHQGRHSLNPLYLGTALGVYYRDDSMVQWEPFDTNLPNVSVRDLDINLEDNIIVAATYGRGVWQTAIPVEVPPSDVKLMAITAPTQNINCGTAISPVITVKNNGSNPIASVNITYSHNAVPQNYVWVGAIAAGASQNINLPVFNVASKGVYNLTVTSTIANDAYSDNNTNVTPFYVNDAGTIGVVNTFESAANSLLTFNEGASVSQWQRGIKTNGALATPGNNVYTTNFSGNYPDVTKSYLYSQCYNLSNAVNPVIKFNLAYDLEQDYDIVYVQYSTNMGQTWNLLGTQGATWYNSNRTPATTGTDCNNCPGGQWTGTNTSLRLYSHSLANLIGQANVIFRIVFHSDDSSNALGVVLDNFVIEGTLSTNDFELKDIAIYPNPSTAIFTLSLANKTIDKLQVYDVSGKVILETQETIQNEYKLDLSSASSGIYFVKITANGQSTVKRIIKN